MSGPLARELISVAGAKTEMLSGGSGQDLLVLHSNWGPDAYSDAYLRLLTDSFRVSAPYHPGYGRHERPRHFVGVDDLAYFYLDYLLQKNLTDVVLLGAGIGGWIANEIAVRSTQRISKLALVAPFGVKTGDRETRDFVDFFALGDLERRRLEFEDPSFHTLDYGKKSDEELTIIARGRESEVHYGWKPFMHNPQLKHWLHRIDVPTLVLRGSEDRIISYANHAAYCELNPRARMELIHGAGHHPHIERPEQLVQNVQAFASDSDFETTRKIASL